MFVNLIGDKGLLLLRVLLLLWEGGIYITRSVSKRVDSYSKKNCARNKNACSWTYTPLSTPVFTLLSHPTPPYKSRVLRLFWWGYPPAYTRFLHGGDPPGYMRLICPPICCYDTPSKASAKLYLSAKYSKSHSTSRAISSALLDASIVAVMRLS